MKNQTWALFTICLGFFIVILDVTIVNAALPEIARGLHSSTAGLQWVVAGYTLSFVCLLMLAGNKVDRFGGKPCLAFGLIGFALTSLACGLAPTIHLLIIFRVLQGVTATVLIPATLSLINVLFTDPKERAKAIGIWSGIGGLAAASGPVICSLLASSFGWRSVFIINVPVAFIALVLLYKTVKVDKHESTKRSFDGAGLFFIVLFSLGLSFAVIEGRAEGWSSSFVIASFSVAILGFLFFLKTEKKANNPIVSLCFFRSKLFSVSILTGFIISSGLYGQLFLLPLYFSRIKHYNVAQIGMAILPLVALITLSSYLSGKAIARSGPQKPAMIGMLMVIIGYVGLILVTHASMGYGWMIVPLAVAGFGFAFALPAATYSAIHSVPKDRSGMASGVFMTARQLGALIAVAVFGAIAMSSHSFVHGLHVTLFIGVLLAAVGFFLNLFVSFFEDNTSDKEQLNTKG